MTESHRLKFRRLKSLYAIVRHSADSAVPEWATRGEFTSITRTSDELSIVCPLENLPADVSSQRWICLKLEGPFPFSQTGVLLSFIEPLSSNGIPIFAIATYDTDYVLIPEEWAGAAISALRGAGHEFVAK
ncbi:MAG TPA: ACT domain-containing protein [Candidatus Binatia bacterium]|nr:ACT domain-containing protein [Candidatus Binatia bacterium]